MNSDAPTQSPASRRSVRREQVAHGHPTRPPFLREVSLIGALYAVYAAGRFLAARDAGSAYDHARAVWTAERWLRLPSERWLQQLVLGSPNLVRAANLYYKYVHFPVTGLVLLWLFWLHPARYIWFRNVLGTLTASALVLHLLYPLAPPRLAGVGVADTGRLFGESVYGQVGKGISDQFAAMPSLHAGWSTLVAVAVIRTLKSPARWLAVLHPVITVFVITVTGNHYLLDSIVALTLLGLSMRIWSSWEPEPSALGVALGEPVPA
jgi:hypothetical protein